MEVVIYYPNVAYGGHCCATIGKRIDETTVDIGHGLF
jgi:hypothetical protein